MSEPLFYSGPEGLYTRSGDRFEPVKDSPYPGPISDPTVDVLWETPATQNVFSLISLGEFEEAFDQAASERQLTFRQAMTYRRAKRNPRVMERVYRRVMEKCPPQIYAGPAGFDFQSFLDWLVENLPAILDLIVKLLPLFLI